MTDSSGSDSGSFGAFLRAPGGGLSAADERGTLPGTDRGTGQVSDVRVVAGSARWERPTARSFWDELAEPERHALAAAGAEGVFRAGSVLCREGEESSQIMIIRSGWAKVSIAAGTHQVGSGELAAGATGAGETEPDEQIIAVRGPGDVVGERAALLTRVRSASVTALDEVRAVAVPAGRFREFLADYPRAAEVLERQVRERHDEDRARLTPAEPLGAEPRLAWLLVDLARRRGGEQPTGFTLPMSQQELANWADTSTDAVGRFIRSWRDRGLVRTDRRQLSVIDLDGLAALCGSAQQHVAARRAGVPVGEILKASPNCSVLFTDVAGFGAKARNDADRAVVRRALYEVLQSAFDEAGVPWSECYHEDRGDGVLTVVPAMPTARVADPLLALLAAKLRTYNRRASEVARIQLRAVLHVGPVGHDGKGLTGQVIIEAARILDAPALKERLAAANADLVFAVSDYVYEHIIRHGPGQVDPASFERVESQVKELHVTAWLQVAGSAASADRSHDPPAVAAAVTSAQPVAAPLGWLPTHVRGRDRLLAELRRPLSRVPRRADRVWVIAGMGGLGKSTVALAVARTAKARGWRVWWVRAADTASLTAGMLEVLRELGAPDSVTGPVREGTPAAAQRAWELLSGPQPGRKWLLVLDGADNPAVLAAAGAQTPADGTGWLRQDPAGMVIVTTRNRDPRVWGNGVTLRGLRPLDEAAGAQALRDLAPNVRDPDGRQARALSRRLGGLPLALHLAGAHLASPFARWASFDGYRAALDSVELPSALRDIDEAGADARTTIQRTWDLSLDALASAGCPQARPLLLVLSCYAPASAIPASLLLQPGPLAALLAAWGSPYPSAAADSVSPAAGDEDHYAERLRVLRDGLHGLSSAGLIDIASSAAGAGAVTVHLVVADVNRSRLASIDRAGRQAVYAAAASLLEAAAARLDSARAADWPAWRLLVPHLGASLELLTGAPDPDPGALVRLVTIGASATDALLRSGQLAAAERLARSSAAAAELAGTGDPATLTARGSLAHTLNRHGRNSQAEQLYRALLADQRRVLGPGHRDTLATRHDLARAIGLQGRYREAELAYRELLADQDRVLGPGDPDTLRTRHSMARSIGLQGRYAEAERMCGEVLGDRQRVLGGGHPDTLATRHLLARVIGLQGRYAEAERLFEEVLAGRQQVLGEEHPDTMATRHRLARVIGLQGRYAEAEQRCRAVLADRRRLLADKHPDNIAAWHRLARIAGLQGRYAEAERLFQEVLADRQQVLGAEHPDTLTTGHWLAWMTGLRGRYGEAEELLAQVLGRRRQVLGDDHPDTLSARDTLAWLTGRQGRYPEAERLCASVLADKRRVLGDDHPDTLTSIDTLAWLTGMQGRHADAERLYRQALADRSRVLGDDHPDTLATRHDLIRTIGAQGRYAEAEQQCREVLADRRRVLGDDHPDTLASRELLAWLAHRQGRHAEAGQIYREVLEARRRVLGADHPDTVATADKLSELTSASPPTAATDQ